MLFPDIRFILTSRTVDRIIDVFPAGEEDMARSLLSESLRAVISQTLLKKIVGGRIAAHEIMIGTPAIRNLIREDKVAQLYSSIQTGQASGMQTLDQNLQDLLRKGLITTQTSKTFNFLANNFAIPAQTVADLYRYRRQVELFFQWIKQHPRIKTVLWDLRERGQKPDLDYYLGLHPHHYHQETPWHRVGFLHNFTDSEPDLIRENSSCSVGYLNEIHKRYCLYS